jgi:hypothetical protein
MHLIRGWDSKNDDGREVVLGDNVEQEHEVRINFGVVTRYGARLASRLFCT